jgi:hypothetical protein
MASSRRQGRARARAPVANLDCRGDAHGGAAGSFRKVRTPPCAGPTVGSAAVTPAAFDEHLVGTWNGVFWAIGEFYYPIEGIMVLQIREDRSFT